MRSSKSRVVIRDRKRKCRRVKCCAVHAVVPKTEEDRTATTRKGSRKRLVYSRVRLYPHQCVAAFAENIFVNSVRPFASRDGVDTHTSTHISGHISRIYHPPGTFLRFINGMVFPIEPDPMAFPSYHATRARLARDETGPESRTQKSSLAVHLTFGTRTRVANGRPKSTLCCPSRSAL